MNAKKQKKKRGRPSIWDSTQPTETPDIETPDIETPDIEAQDLDMSIRRSKLVLPINQWPVLYNCQSILEDVCIFENPFPSAQEEMVAEFDAWRSASRLANIKGEIPELHKDVHQYVSSPLHASRYLYLT